jgi:3-hydroxyacyl-[acyl-carrier-protein] dehydratase
VTDAMRKALESLPHGPDFRFLDELLSLEPGCHGAGIYLVRGDEPFLRGHFPGAPLFPGVLLVEAAAQLAGAVAQSDPEVAPISNLKLAAIRSAKFKGSAEPGQVIRVEARVTGRLGAVVQADTVAWVGDREIMRASVVLSGEEPRG